MKNRHFISIILAACAVFFAACNKDEQFVDMNASIATYGNNGSKVYVDNAHYANWHNGDKVLINNIEKTVSLRTENNQTIASISGVSVSTSGYYAIYPCDRIITFSSTGYPTILMPQVQIYEPLEGKQLINAPMAAYCAHRASGKGHSLNFKNLCSLVEVNVPTNTEVAYINVTSTNHFLWGKASITGGDDPELVIDEANTESEYSTDNYTVTLDCTTNGSQGSNAGGSAAEGKTGGPFYVVIPKGTYENLTVDVYIFATDSDGSRRTVKLYSKTANATNNSATVEANQIYKVVCEGEPSTVQPPYPGLGTGEFSVSATKKVRFSQGNLQYCNGVWRFSENELESFRNTSDHNSVMNNREQNWIDLFGFGTSGKGSLSTATPTTYLNTNNLYPQDNLTASNLYDWGVNEISNGGNQPNKWRTLTRAEWQYLFGNSTNRVNKTRRAVILDNNNSVVITGLIIAPDVCSAANGWNSVTDYALRITEEQYIATYQSAGCVFLPVTGYYVYVPAGSGNPEIINVNDCSNPPVGWYWTSTYEDSEPWAAKAICDGTMGISFAGQGVEVYRGCAVRLVRDVD